MNDSADNASQSSHISEHSEDCVMVSLEDALKELDGKPICSYCKSKLDKGGIPNICLINNMYRGKCPPELLCLNHLEMMMCRLVKCFQTVIKPGPISSKMPHSDRLQAVKGRFIHLPLATAETLAHAASTDRSEMFSNIENYVLVYGLPTKANKVLRELVDRSKVFAAMRKLKEINPFYADVPLPEMEEDFLPDVFGGDDDEDSDVDADGDQRMSEVADPDETVSGWRCQHCDISSYRNVCDLLKHESKCPDNPNADTDSDSDSDSDSEQTKSCDESDVLSQTLSQMSFERNEQSDDDDADSDISTVCTFFVAFNYRVGDGLSKFLHFAHIGVFHGYNSRFSKRKLRILLANNWLEVSSIFA